MILCGDAFGNVVGADLDSGSGLNCGDFPRHGHGAAVPRLVRDKVHLLHDPHTGHESDEAALDDVRIHCCFAPRGRGVCVGQDHPVGTARPGVEVLESARHSLRREPGHECNRVDEGGVNVFTRGSDHTGGGVRPCHEQILRSYELPALSGLVKRAVDIDGTSLYVLVNQSVEDGWPR